MEVRVVCSSTAKKNEKKNTIILRVKALNTMKVSVVFNSTAKKIKTL